MANWCNKTSWFYSNKNSKINKENWLHNCSTNNSFISRLKTKRRWITNDHSSLMDHCNYTGSRNIMPPPINSITNSKPLCRSSIFNTNANEITSKSMKMQSRKISTVSCKLKMKKIKFNWKKFIKKECLTKISSIKGDSLFSRNQLGNCHQRVTACWENWSTTNIIRIKGEYLSRTNKDTHK